LGYFLIGNGVESVSILLCFPWDTFIFQVNFDLGILEHAESSTYRDLMALYVLSRFDLPTCRVVVSISFTENIAYIINACAFNVYEDNTCELRKKKYAERVVQNRKINPPNLKISILFNLIIQLS